MSKTLLFAGIAGHAMRGLALAARDQGYVVRGLDEAAVPPGSDWLDQNGLEWSRTFAPSLLDGVDEVILSGGTGADHPLVAEARRRGLALVPFAELVGRLTKDARVLSVGGTHGKTTTSSLLLWILESAGRKPDYLIGIQPLNFNSSARFAGSACAVIEGDEYRASALDNRSKLQYYHPDVLILTSVEHDHPDVFPTEDDVVKRFKEIVSALPPSGRLIAWGGSPQVREVARAAVCPIVFYEESRGEACAARVSYKPEGLVLDVSTPDGPVPDLRVALYGRHNVLNVVAAVTAARAEGVTPDEIRSALASFRGAYRRFTLLTSPTAPIVVIDDYAHHPTEVQTTIEAARLHFPGRGLLAVFRPHTYSRTGALLAEYQKAFDKADLAYIAPIEGARESGQKIRVSGADIATGIGSAGRYVPGRIELAELVASEAGTGDVILSMTVSGYDKIAEDLMNRLSS